MLFFCLFTFLVSVQTAPTNFFDLGHNGSTIYDVDLNTRPQKCLKDEVRIPVVFSKDLPNEFYDLIKYVLDDFENQTCLQFEKEEYNEDENAITSNFNFSIYFAFQKHTIRDCYNVRYKVEGERSFRTLVVLNQNACFNNTRRIKQLIFGALGFIHENLRSDRDDHVTILWDNIVPGYETEFRKVKENVVNFVLPYDRLSISHHYSDYYSKDGKPTSVSKDEKLPLQRKNELSVLDLLKIDTVYCKANETTRDRDIRDQFLIFPLYIPYVDDSTENITTADPASDTETTYYRSRIIEE